jgi:glycosyltransferase involved in cell wall biosynthesis
MTRVLILNSEYPPIGAGAGNASAHIAKSLASKGLDVTVLTASFANLPREQTLEGVRIIRLPGLRSKADRSTALEQLIFMVVAGIWGQVWLAKIRPQIVLAFFGAPAGVAAWAWSFFRRLPYIVFLRGGDVPGFRPYDFGRLHRLLGPLLRLVWRRAAAVVANSQGLRQLGEAFEPDIPIQVIVNGVEAKNFQVAKRKWQPPRILFVGRVVYQKGLDLLLKALGELRDIPWELSIVGDGSHMELIKQQAVELELSDRITFEGWKPRESLPSLFQKANLFVMPSRHEGMPNALLEAMASGLPAIATQIAGNEELIKEGKTGLLIPSEDSITLRSTLRDILEDDKRRKRMGQAAQQRAKTLYNWEIVSEAYLQLIEESLQNS